MTYKLIDIASVIRSKNSGPYEITFDIIFKDYELFEKTANAKVINPEMFAKLYHIPVSEVLGVIEFAAAKAIKITIKRPICSGDLGETDVYGAQQHAPLLDLTFSL